MSPAAPVPREKFDPVWYLRANPDVRAAGVDPWEHYCQYGFAEGRAGRSLAALDLDHALWRGLEAEALIGLEALRTGPDPEEAAVAAWVLARWHAAAGDWTGAEPAIAAFLATEAGREVVDHPGPDLLGLQSAVRAGERATARARLTALGARHGTGPETVLAAMECARAEGDAAGQGRALADLHGAAGLAPLRLAPGTGPAFDRLEAAPGPAADLPPDLPLVSVIVPVFNAGGTLGTALAGLATQDWPRLEVLVVDDGSTDDSARIARRFAARDPRFRLLSPEDGPGGNQGAYAARNRGFAEAAGQFVTVQDADDWSHPARIRLQAEALIADPAARASVAHWVRVDDDLAPALWRIETGWAHRCVSSLMLRRDLHETLGYWDRVRVDADTEYYHRLLAAFGPGAVTEVRPGLPLAFGRTGPSTLTGQAATHARTRFFGLRRAYQEAARLWHRAALAAGQGEEGADRHPLYMPYAPGCRLFNVPEGIGPQDPPGPLTAYDRIAGSDMLDPLWYWRAHPDVLAADIHPARHLLETGATEDRAPGPRFSASAYRRAAGLAPGEPALLHWETAGRAAGADPRPPLPGALEGGQGERVLVCGHLSGGTLFGAERSLLQTLRRLGRAGLRPVTVLPSADNPDYLGAVAGLSAAVEILPQLWRHGARAPAPVTVEALRAMIRRHAVREVHVNTLVLDAPLAAARAEGRPAVVHVRELPAGDPELCRALGMAPEALRAALLAEADRFVANSPAVARWIDAPGRVEIRPNAIEESLFSLPFDPGPALRVAMAGNLTARKGIDDFFAVARAVAAAGDPARFVLIGPETDEMRALRPWPENVTHLGYLPGAGAAMAEADVVLSLSHFDESFGRTVAEAMAAGRPVICYDRGMPPGLIRHRWTGFAVPPGRPDIVARAVLALSAGRIGLERMSAAARIRARELQAEAGDGEGA